MARLVAEGLHLARGGRDAREVAAGVVVVEDLEADRIGGGLHEAVGAVGQGHRVLPVNLQVRACHVDGDAGLVLELDDVERARAEGDNLAALVVSS